MSLRLGALVFLAIAAALILACGGDSEGTPTGAEGTPTPTGTAPIFDRSPTPTTPVGSPTPATPTPTPAEATPPGGVTVTPVAEPFEVTVSAENSGLRIREAPTTDAAILDVIYVGERATVLGEAQGEEAESGKGDLWYQVDFTRNGTTVRGFVYAPLVEEAE